jgi:hypothetical protein
MSIVSRDGEPELKRGPTPDSLKRQNEYWVRTTPVPPGDNGIDWFGYSIPAGPSAFLWVSRRKQDHR